MAYYESKNLPIDFSTGISSSQTMRQCEDGAFLCKGTTPY